MYPVRSILARVNVLHRRNCQPLFAHLGIAHQIVYVIMIRGTLLVSIRHVRRHFRARCNGTNRQRTQSKPRITVVFISFLQHALTSTPDARKSKLNERLPQPSCSFGGLYRSLEKQIRTDETDSGSASKKSVLLVFSTDNKMTRTVLGACSISEPTLLPRRLGITSFSEQNRCVIEFWRNFVLPSGLLSVLSDPLAAFLKLHQPAHLH
jgi:hypothetical protein